MKQYNFSKGKQGEQIACEFLKKKGYKIIKSNYRTRYGEIDIVCSKSTLNPSFEERRDTMPAFNNRPNILPFLKGPLRQSFSEARRIKEGFESILVFVEVKLKSGSDFGTPEDMITPGKINQVQRTAEMFLLQEKALATQFKQYRIDAICIAVDSNGRQIVNHYENVPEQF